MKLVIEIPDDKYDLLKMSVESGMGDWVHKIVANGTPLESMLEDIKAEIKAHSEMHYMDGDIIADELLTIIDKHMRGAEDET